MKKIFYILILAIILVALCGCRQEAAEQSGLQEMPSISINVEEDLDDDYILADVIVQDERLQAEVKLRGNSSKEVTKKAYTIKFDEELALFGMDSGRKWALVSNPFDKSLLRPAVGFAYAEALGIDYTSQTRLCQVWINDVYMGVYTAMEPVEAGEGRVEIETAAGTSHGVAGTGDGPGQCDFLLERNMERYEGDKVYLDSPAGLRFELNEPEEPTELQLAQCHDLLAAAEEAICSRDHRQYENVIDVDSFVNFYIFHEMIKDVDFGEYSTRYYFKDGILHAGPPWDLDLTMGNVSTEKDEFKYAAYNNVDGAGEPMYQVISGVGEQGAGGWNSSEYDAEKPFAITGSASGLWAATGDYYYWLCRDPWFMELVQQRWQAVRPVTENLAVDNELGENLIDRYLGAYEDELESNFTQGGYVGDACWSIDAPAHMSEWQEPASDYQGNVEMLRQWLIKRAAYLDSQFGPFVYTPALAVL